MKLKTQSKIIMIVYNERKDTNKIGEKKGAVSGQCFKANSADSKLTKQDNWKERKNNKKKKKKAKGTCQMATTFKAINCCKENDLKQTLNKPIN